MATRDEPLGPKDPRSLPYAPGPAFDQGPRTLFEIQADLKRPIHPDITKTKPKGGQTLHFIEWHTAVRLLDKYAPGWQSEASAVIDGNGKQVVIMVRIGIPTSDYGMVWRAATSQDEDSDSGYGEAIERAEGAALRRAAAKFGLGLDWYSKK